MTWLVKWLFDLYLPMHKISKHRHCSSISIEPYVMFDRNLQLGDCCLYLLQFSCWYINPTAINDILFKECSF